MPPTGGVSPPLRSGRLRAPGLAATPPGYAAALRSLRLKRTALELQAQAYRRSSRPQAYCQPLRVVAVPKRHGSSPQPSRRSAARGLAASLRSGRRSSASMPHQYCRGIHAPAAARGPAPAHRSGGPRLEDSPYCGPSRSFHGRAAPGGRAAGRKPPPPPGIHALRRRGIHAPGRIFCGGIHAAAAFGLSCSSSTLLPGLSRQSRVSRQHADETSARLRREFRRIHAVDQEPEAPGSWTSFPLLCDPSSPGRRRRTTPAFLS